MPNWTRRWPNWRRPAAWLRRSWGALLSRQERLEVLKRDKDALLESYARMTPKALDSLTAEERHRVYGMLGLKATITMDGSMEVSGAFSGEGDVLCGTTTRYSTP